MNGPTNRRGRHGKEVVTAPRRFSHEEEADTPHPNPEQELRESEQKYRSLVETLPHAVIIIQDNKIVFANTRAAEALGFDREADIIDRDLLEFVAENEKERLKGYLHRRLSCESDVPEQYETVLRTRSGQELYGEIRVKTLVFKGRKASQLVVTDITGRRRSETQMRLFMEALEQRDESIAFFGLDGHLVFSNRSFASLHGYRPEELEGEHIAVLVPTEELLSLVAANEETLRVGQSTTELVHVHKDGGSLPVLRTSTLVRDNQGSPIGMILTIRNMSEFKVSESVFSHAREKLSRYSGELEKQLGETSAQLGDSQSEVKKFARRLEQAKEALKLVTMEVESRNNEREHTVYRNLNSNVLTIIDQLKSQRLPDSSRLLLDSLEFNLKSLFSHQERIVPMDRAHLTPQETRLCELARAGLTTKQMAEALGISSATVVVHRANIRKKLGLVGSEDNLATFLRHYL